MNTLVSVPNVSTPCPLDTCPWVQPDGTMVCLPCMALDGASSPLPVPALDVWAALVLGAALVAVGVLKTRGR